MEVLVSENMGLLSCGRRRHNKKRNQSKLICFFRSGAVSGMTISGIKRLMETRQADSIYPLRQIEPSRNIYMMEPGPRRYS